jgi:hypothetical protein
VGLWFALHLAAAPAALLAGVLALALSLLPSQRRAAQLLGALAAVTGTWLCTLFAAAYGNISLRTPEPSDLIDKDDLLRSCVGNGVIALAALAIGLLTTWRSLRRAA